MPRGYKPIEIGDKDTFDGYFKRFPPEISEYTFTNLFMWREHYHFSWQLVDGCLVLLSRKDPSKIIAFPPVGEEPARVLTKVVADIKAEGLAVECHRIPESLVHVIKQSGQLGEFKLDIDVIDDRDNWDYVYRTMDLATLEGPRYADFRKKLSRFNRDHQVEFLKLDETSVGKCLEMQEEWCNLKACKESEGLSRENAAIKDAFQHWKELGFFGCIMVEDGRIIAYTLGDWLNPTTAVCHIEKANPRPSFFGAYQAISRHFATNCAKDFEFINREQDIGEPGLRRAKESYNPTSMVKKFILRVK